MSSQKTVLVIGKDFELHERGCISHYCGVYNAHSDAELEGRRLAIRKLQEVFEASGIVFVLVITPSKAVTVPHRTPSRLCPTPIGSDYRRFMSDLEKRDVNMVDGQKVTFEFTDRTGLVAFPRTGTHWHLYAAVETVNATIQKLDRLYPDRYPRLKPIQIASVDLDDAPTPTDADRLNLLSLFRPDRSIGVGKSRLRIAVGGASFTNYLIDVRQNRRAAETSQFWYYSLGRSDASPGKPTVYFERGAGYDLHQNCFEKDSGFLEVNCSAIPAPHAQLFYEAVLDYQKKRGAH